MNLDLKKDELFEPEHLSYEDLNLIKRRAEALEAGFDTMNDDPIERGLVHAYIMNTIDVEQDELDLKFKEQSERKLSPEQKEQLLNTLKTRFESNMKRHKGIEWTKVQAKLTEASPKKLWSLNKMEKTGGEPDVVGYEETTDEYEFFDCSAESPSERRNVCYDREGQEKAERQGYTPAGNAVDMAEAMGLGGILDEEQYKNKLQKLGKFDLNTWSWVKTPADKREAGVALHGDRLHAYVYVNGNSPNHHHVTGAFRGWLRV